MGTLKVRFPTGPGGAWIPLTGIGAAGAITQDQADSRYVNVTGDTMTGQLTFRAGSGLVLATIGDGAHIGFYDDTGNNRRGYLQGHAQGVNLSADVGYLQLISAAGYVQFPASCRVGVPTAYGSVYGGLSWSTGDYLIMSDGTNTFVSTPSASGGVYIRGAKNGSGLFIDSAGNTSAAGIVTSTGFNLNGNNSFYFASWGGGWYMTDGTYLRSTNDKHVWLGGGWFGSNGGVQIGYSGIASYGYALDINGSCRLGNTVTLGQCRIECNGGNGAAYYNHAYLAQNGAAARTGYSIHPGGVAKSIEMMQSNGYINFLNEGGDWYADLYAASITQVSQQRGKQDIAEWPSKSLEVNGASSRLSLIDVITYRYKAELALQDAESWLPDENGEVHPRVHDCATDIYCDGTDEVPCQRVKEWRDHPHLGVIIEDLATVLPEAIGLDPDGNPGGMRLGSMIGFLLAVCKEQQEEIERIKSQLPSAA